MRSWIKPYDEVAGSVGGCQEGVFRGVGAGNVITEGFTVCTCTPMVEKVQITAGGVSV